jgi:predicted nuclease with RNAse H fold
MPRSVFVGIDVACRAGKRLPLCAVATTGDRLEPLSIPATLAARIPRGRGNREITEAEPFREAALQAARAVREIAAAMDWSIERIAVDAPGAPPSAGPRASEHELGREGLSSFSTPARAAWDGIRERGSRHLDERGQLARLPHANKIWMLFGFALFESLRAELGCEVIEVYPFAIVRALLESCAHKSTEQGYRDQLTAIAAQTGWDPGELEAQLKPSVPGSRHDRLDAFMAAWVASLPADQCRAYGDPADPDDAIWVPLSRVAGAGQRSGLQAEGTKV